MKLLSLVLTIFASISSWSAGNLNAENCVQESPSENFIYHSDFKWGFNLPEMFSVFEKMYASNKRLKNRAYVDQTSGQLILPHNPQQGGNVKIPSSFPQNVAFHIESGFHKDVIDAVFFPDMGHSHFFIPNSKWNDDPKYREAMKGTNREIYELFFADQDLKVLYHTAEQLKMLNENNQVLPDARIQHRFKTRNLVGYNNGSKEIFFLQNPGHVANTAGELPEHFYWGAGFNISANEKGCFYYTRDGKKFNFDISLYDLSYDPALPQEPDFR